MKAGKKNRGASLVIVLVVLAAVLVGLYMVSPVASTRIKQLYTDELTWSPRQIARDPVGYARYGIDRAQVAAVKALEVAIAVRQADIRNGRLLEEAQQKQTAAKTLFNEFRSAYTDAQASGVWPQTLRGAEYDEEELRQQIIDLKRTHDALAGEAARRAGNESAYRARYRQAEQDRAEALEKQAFFQECVSELRLHEMGVDLTELEEQMRLLNEIYAGATFSDDAPTVEGLVMEESQAGAPVDFDAILREEL